MENTVKAALYARVSSDRQEHEETIQSQLVERVIVEKGRVRVDMIIPVPSDDRLRTRRGELVEL